MNHNQPGSRSLRDAYAHLAPRLRELTRRGLSRWAIADTLNAEGVQSISGAPWNEVMVSALCERLDIKAREAYLDSLIERLAEVMKALGAPPRFAQNKWDATVVSKAREMGVSLLGPATYARRFGSVAHAIDLARVHLGEQGYRKEDMLGTLGVFVKAFEGAPQVGDYRAGWDQETCRRAQSLQLRLPTARLYTHQFGSIDEAVSQVVSHMS